MKRKLKDFFKKLVISLFALSVPVLMGLYAVQAKRYTDLTKDIAELERNQEKLIEENKLLVRNIAVLSSADRIEKIAVDELGMHKADSEDIIRVEMTGERQ